MVYVYSLKVMNNVVIYIMVKLYINNQKVKNVLPVRVMAKLYKLEVKKNIVLVNHIINNNTHLLVY